jgi:hypothetical protein
MLNETFLPCGQWLPDQPSYKNPGCSIANNVVPVTASTFAPMPAFGVAATTALDSKPLAAFSARDGEGNAALYAGTASKLYSGLAVTAPNFADKTRLSGDYTAASWGFAAFNGNVYAVNGVDPMQTVQIATTSRFADVGGGAPTGKILAVVQPGFLVVGNINDPTVGIQPQGLRWSALGDASSATGWPAIGSTDAIAVQSDWQNITGDHGNLTGIAPDLPTCAAAVFFENAIYQMNYTGDQFIFTFTPVAKAMGTGAPASIVQRNQTVYYLGSDGFYAFDGTVSYSISANRVSRFFFERCDPNYLPQVSGFVDPATGLIFWAYATSGSNNGVPNRMLVYNTVTDRWSNIMDFRGYCPFLGRSLGISLDQIDGLGYTIDDIPFSLDDRHLAGGLNVLAGFSPDFKLGYFAGAPMDWAVETVEAQLARPRRARLGYVRPIVEGGIPQVAAAARDDLRRLPTFGNSISPNSAGVCPVRVEGRYHRLKLTGSGDTRVTHIQGAEVGFTPAGNR